MLKIFNFQTITSQLDQKTRSLFVRLNNGSKNYISREMLFELENLINWVNSHIEISAVYFYADTEYFSYGMDPLVLEKYSAEQLKSFSNQLSKISDLIHSLPQTVIINVGKGTFNIASEFILPFDLRIGSDECRINFEHHQLGLIPSSGGINYLSTLFNPNLAKNWILSNQEIDTLLLINSGFLYKTYQAKEEERRIVAELLLSMQKQSSVARIQSKFGINQTYQDLLDKNSQTEKSILNAFALTEDWQTKVPSSFTPANQLKEKVKLKLIKNEDMIN